MNLRIENCLMVTALPVSSAALGQEPGATRPQRVLKRVISSMPRADSQQVRVMTASFRPGDQTVFFCASDPETPFLGPIP